MTTYKPFLNLGLLCIFTVLITSSFRQDSPVSQFVYAIINAIFMLTICLVDISIRFKQVKPRLIEFKQFWLKPVLATSSLLIFLVLAIFSSSTSVSQPKARAATKNTNTAISISRSANNNMSTDQLIEQISLVPAMDHPEPHTGMYNEKLDLSKNNKPYIQHSFVDWRDTHYLALCLATTVQSDNTPLITVEPRGTNDGIQLLDEINSGHFDAQINEMTRIIKASKRPVYIRFGHEMELANLYPWGNKPPEKYILAYRHFAEALRSGGAENAKFVWSPAGNQGAEAYYPGNEYVDVIGTTILYDQYWFGNYLPSFAQLSENRKWLGAYNKPVWIVEFGAGNKSPSDQTTLISEAVNEYRTQGFSSLVYLNLIDANIQGPDYRLNSPDEFGHFFE